MRDHSSHQGLFFLYQILPKKDSNSEIGKFEELEVRLEPTKIGQKLTKYNCQKQLVGIAHRFHMANQKLVVFDLIFVVFDFLISNFRHIL